MSDHTKKMIEELEARALRSDIYTKARIELMIERLKDNQPVRVSDVKFLENNY